MKHRVWLATCALGFAATSCVTTPPHEPAGPPVPKPLSLLAIARESGTVYGTNAYRLKWTASPYQSITNYALSITADGFATNVDLGFVTNVSLTEITQVLDDAGNVRSTLHPFGIQLTNVYAWHWSVTAVDSQGNSSLPSDPVQFPPAETPPWNAVKLNWNVTTNVVIESSTDLNQWHYVTNVTGNSLMLPRQQGSSIFYRVAASASLTLSISAAYLATPKPVDSNVYSVTLAWSPSPDQNVTGYNIYYGHDSRVYSHKVNAGLPQDNALGLTNLSSGKTYYFTATAYNALDVESDYSNEVSYGRDKQWFAPENVIAAPTKTGIAFSWQPVSTPDVEYTLHIDSATFNTGTNNWFETNLAPGKYAASVSVSDGQTTFTNSVQTQFSIPAKPVVDLTVF